MPRPAVNPGSATVKVGLTPDAVGRPRRDDPFRVLILGDLRGRGVKDVATESPAGTLSDRRPTLVDRDNFDAVLARFAASAIPDVPLGSLDDFHPDALFDRLPVFAQLRRLRKQLQTPASFAAAREELQQLAWFQAAARAATTPPNTTPPTTVAPPAVLPNQRPEYSVEGLFDSVLDASMPTVTPAGESDATRWERAIRDVAAKHSLPATASEIDRLAAWIDDAVAHEMRSILRTLRPLEAVWRGIGFLLRRAAEDDTTLSFHLFDATRAELTADLTAADDLSGSALHRVLVDETVGTPGAAPWSLVVVLQSFADSASDANLLGRLAKLSAAAGAALLADADATLCGCDSLVDTPLPEHWTRTAAAQDVDAWRQLRALPEARWVGLAIPRLLLRLPYGQQTNPVESFRFEEQSSPPAHNEYLWGRAALACAVSVARAFAADGWQMRPEDYLDLEDLPLHVFQTEGQTTTQPCAECLLVDRAVEALQDRGLIPLVSYRDADRVRIAGLRSIAGPGTPLAGRWNLPESQQ